YLLSLPPHPHWMLHCAPLHFRPVRPYFRSQSWASELQWWRLSCPPLPSHRSTDWLSDPVAWSRLHPRLDKSHYLRDNYDDLSTRLPGKRRPTRTVKRVTLVDDCSSAFIGQQPASSAGFLIKKSRATGASQSMKIANGCSQGRGHIPPAFHMMYQHVNDWHGDRKS